MKLQNFFLIFIAALFLNTATGQENQITNVHNRKYISLNGKWNYIIDQAEIGLKRKYYQDKKPKGSFNLYEYDFDGTDLLNVPGDWNSQELFLKYYEGKIWYRKKFNIEKKNDKRYFVYIGAANYTTNVYLNGTKLGSHEGGFTPFNFEITELLNSENENSLVISVDNTRSPEQIPTTISDWKNYGGITRDVLIIEENTTFIRDYFIHLSKDDPNKIEGWVQLDGEKLENVVKLGIPELKQIRIVTNASGYGTFSIRLKKIEHWSPENPKLYDVKLILDDEQLNDKIGFRTIETKGVDILLNGKSVFLKGISLHEVSPLRKGRAYSVEDAQMLLNWAKELNCNYVRLAHYPHSEHIVRLADEMGILVWEEIPVYWDIKWENKTTYSLAESMLNDIIVRDKNRASVIIWSVANETDISEARNKFLGDLISFTRKNDPTRLVSAALLTNDEESTKQDKVINDPFGQNADIISLNQYIGWYGGFAGNLDKLKWLVGFDKPFIFSEFGAGALYGMHGDIKTRWSEEFQEYYYQKTLEMCDGVPNLRGISPWILVDFESPRRMYRGIQDGYNRKGLISDDGNKKKAFFVLQKYYKNKVF